jgi:predicted transcriptional regulator
MHFRLSSVLLARLDKLAEAWGLSRSEVVRRLVADADADGVAPLERRTVV